MQSGLELIESGQVETGLALLKEDHATRPSYKTMANLAFGYLHIRELSSAKIWFDQWITVEKPRLSASYVWAGAVRWLLGTRSDAVSVWKAGLECPYRDAAGGLQIPLLLFYAAIRDPKVQDVKDSRALIGQRLESPWAKNWPGPLGGLVLGRSSEQQVRAQAAANAELVATRQLSQLEFYVGVMALLEGNPTHFLQHMRECVSNWESRANVEYTLAQNELAGEDAEKAAE